MEIRQYLPGFEALFTYEDISNPKEVIDFFEEQGFDYLQDWHDSEYSVSERILTPSGRVLEYSDIMTFLDTLPPTHSKRKEFSDALIYLCAINHYEISLDERLRGRASFLNKEDEEKHKIKSQ